MQMTLPAYVVPPTSITWVGGNTLPPQYLCSQEDAQLVAKETGGKLANGADFFKDFGITFVGLLPTDKLQPWVITLDGNTNFVGPTVVMMWAPNDTNGGGVGNQGSLQKVNGQWKWVPVAPTVIVTPPVSSIGDLAGYLAALGLNAAGITPIDQQILNLLLEIKAKTDTIHV